MQKKKILSSFLSFVRLDLILEYIENKRIPKCCSYTLTIRAQK